MNNVPGAPLPPEPSLSLMEFSLICTAIGFWCVIAGLIILWLEKRGRRR